MDVSKLKTGDIVVSRYGYNMVLYDFYKVLKLNDKSITLQEMTKTALGNLNSSYCPVKPVCLDERAKPFRRKLHKDYIKVTDYQHIFDKYDDSAVYAEDHMD